jgi:hypothetical protein
MARPRKNTTFLQTLAKLGAQARLTTLKSEMQAIYAQFPDLRTVARSVARAVGMDAPVKRKRRKMSKAARLKIGAAQRKRWAAQRAAKQ